MDTTPPADIIYDFYEPEKKPFPWRSVLMFVGMIGLIILVVYFFMAAFNRRKLRNARRRPKKYKNRYSEVATDDIAIVYEAHTNDTADPLVAVYNRPDIVVANEDLRNDVIMRMRKTIMRDDFDDIEMLERIVNINEDLDLDGHIAEMAPVVAARIGHNNNANFNVRANDVLRLADDSQNVHDPVVIKELKGVLDNFTKNPQAEYASTFSDGHEVSRDANIIIDKMILRGEISENRANDARRVLSKMISSNDTCMSYGNRRESEIFKTTWASADTHDKRHNIILGLADAASGSGTVCMNGRIARILGANTTQVSGAELKSAVYSYAGKVMNDGGRFGDVENYINGIEQFTDSQKNILINECKAVFDDMADDAPIGQQSNADAIIATQTVDNGPSGINIAEPPPPIVVEHPMETTTTIAPTVDAATAIIS